MAAIRRSALCIVFALAACGSSTPTDTGNSGGTTPPTVATVAVTGSNAALVPGATVQLGAAARDASGQAITGKTFTWTSSAPTIATVSTAGLVTAVAAGSVTVSAAVDGVTGSIALTVNAAPAIPVASVTVTTGRIAFTAGDTAQYTATTRDASGNVLIGRTVTWTSTAANVATVSSTGLVTAVGAGAASITASSEGITSTGISITVTAATGATLLEQRVLTQQGLAIALASTVLQSQLTTLITLVGGGDNSCEPYDQGGSYRMITAAGALPAQVNIYFDAGCTRPYMVETVTGFTEDENAGNFHIVASAAYTGPTGVSLGTITFDESAGNISSGANGRLLGTVDGLGVFTSASGTGHANLGLNCNFSDTNHAIALCQGGIMQNFTALNAASGSVTTLGLDSTAAGAVVFSGQSVLTTGALNALTLTAPSTLSMVVQGGTAYGGTTATGSAANFSLFPPTPTGWTVADSAHDQVFAISVVDNAVRNLTGTIKQISTGATLATFALDQSGTGTITYSDSTSATVTSWIVSQ